MKEVQQLIEELQARLQNAGGGEILITHKTFTIKLTESVENTTSFVSKTRNI
jgi:hypothetical protein